MEHQVPPETGIAYGPSWDGTDADCCLAWPSVRQQADSLWIRIGVRDILACEAEAVGTPAVIRMGAGRFLVAAPVGTHGVWHCGLYDARRDGVTPWDPIFFAGTFVSRVRAARTAEGAPVLAFGLQHARKASVCVRQCRNNAWETLFESPGELDAYRPAVAPSGTRMAVAFDAWDGHAYQVYVQRGTACRQVSQGPGWHTSPDLVSDGTGRLWIAWVCQEDVISPEGAIDQRYTLRVVSLSPDGADDAVSEPRQAGDLSHGLLDTSPDPRGVMGYHGRRIHPLLLGSQEGGVHLLWEQKERHEGTTRLNTGILWGRRLSDSGMGDVTPVLSGGLWYETPGSKCSHSNRIEVAGFKGIDGLERQVALFTSGTEPPAASRLPASAWSGWRPVSLPLPRAAVDARPSVEVDGERLWLYWLDPHAHSGRSGDAEGELDVCHRYGRHKANVDGMLLSDNDFMYGVALSRADWAACCAAAEAHNRNGVFVALNGYEWTCMRHGQDHRTVLLPAPQPDIVRWNEHDGDRAALCRYVDERGGILHAHHIHWNLTDSAVEANVEVASGWDTCIETSTACIHAALTAGRRFGFVGGSDSHRRNPGLGGALTGVWARALDREAILDAFRRHRCFATDGCRPVIAFRANGRFMGEAVIARDILFHISVTASTPIESVELWRPEGCLQRWSAAGAASLQTRHALEGLTEDTACYVRVVLAGAPRPRVNLPANLQPAAGHYAWSSPIFCIPPRGRHAP